MEGKGETEKLSLRSGDRLGEGEEEEEGEEEVGGEVVGDEREEGTWKEFAPVKLREKSLSPKGKIIFQLPFFKSILSLFLQIYLGRRLVEVFLPLCPCDLASPLYFAALSTSAPPPCS